MKDLMNKIYKDNDLEKSDIYKGFRANDEIKENIKLLEDFAKKSNFREFYKAHNSYYLKLGELFRVESQPEKIWQWLESNFPEKYQSYKVFFSPLGPGNHSARMFTNSDFKETIMFISGPNRYFEKSESPSVNSIKLSRSFFTEIDHAYVNPTSNKYVENINAVLNNLKPWYKGGGYNKPYLVFNEYMTWAVFSLFTLDNYSDDNYQFSKSYIEKFMQENKGFYKFKEFNNELTRLYKLKSEEEKIVDLYPEILNWIKIESNAASP